MIYWWKCEIIVSALFQRSRYRSSYCSYANGYKYKEELGIYFEVMYRGRRFCLCLSSQVASDHIQTQPHSVGRIFTYDQSDAETSNQKHTTHITTDTNPCILRDVNPQSQQSRGRKHMPYTVRPLRSAGFLSVMQKVMDRGEQEESVTVFCLVVYLEQRSVDGVLF